MTQERRVVAIVFAQAQGLADRPDLADALFMSWRRAVERSGGAVDKFFGEVGMAVFGAPVAHGDDARRALAAALDMRRAMEAEAKGLAFRAGVNLGEVLYGSVGGDRPTVMGDVVNVAQRLQEAAGPGEILVSAELSRAVAGYAFSRREPLRVRGRVEPIEHFEAMGLREGSTIAKVESAPLIGRDAEVARLESFLDGGGAAVVTGEAGSGKSRLLAEFRRRVRRRPGVTILTGHAAESARLPLGAFGAALRSVAPGGAAAVARWMTPSLDEPARRLVLASVGDEPHDERSRALPPEKLREETADAWAELLRRRAPLVLTAEDLHWADAETPALLEALAVRLRGAAVVLLASARPGGSLPAGFERVDLAALEAGSSLRLASAVLGRRIAPALGAFLLEQAGGNPYYVSEMAKWLEREGHVSGDPAELRHRPAKLPAGLQGLLVAQLDALPKAEKEALKSASVFGGNFWVGALNETAGEESREPLDAAAARGLLVRRPGSLLADDEELAFSHAMLRQAAYSLLPKRRRAKLHEAAAVALERRGETGGRRVRALSGIQFAAAGKAAEAARIFVACANDAVSDASNAEALDLADQARSAGATASAAILASRAFLALARPEEAIRSAGEAAADPGASAEDRCRAQICIASTHERMAHYEMSLGDAAKAVSMAPGPRLLAAALWAHGAALFRLGRTQEAEAATQKARAAVAGAPFNEGGALENDVEGRILNSLGLILLTRGDHAKAKEVLQEGLAWMRKQGNRRGMMVALSNLGIASSRLGLYREALEDYRGALAVAEESGDPVQQGILWNNMGSASWYLEDDLAALQAFRKSMDLRRKAGDFEGLLTSGCNCTLILRRQGRTEEAVALSDECVAIAKQVGTRGAQVEVSGSQAGILLDLGRPDEALPWFDLGIAFYREAGNRTFLAQMLGERASCLREAGRIPEAREAFREAVTVSRELGETERAWSRLGEWAQLESLAGDEARAAELFREASALQDGWRSPDIQTHAVRLDSPEGDARAEREFAGHLETWRRTGRKFEETNVLLNRAFFRWNRGLPGAADDVRAAIALRPSPLLPIHALLLAASAVSSTDRDEARALLAQAREAIRRCRSFATKLWFAEFEIRALAAIGDAAGAKRVAGEAAAMSLGYGAAGAARSLVEDTARLLAEASR